MVQTFGSGTLPLIPHKAKNVQKSLACCFLPLFVPFVVSHRKGRRFLGRLNDNLGWRQRPGLSLANNSLFSWQLWRRHSLRYGGGGGGGGLGSTAAAAMGLLPRQTQCRRCVRSGADRLGAAKGKLC